MTSYGYARTSTSRQAGGVETQRQQLLKAGIDSHHIYADLGVSGKEASRPEWDKLLKLLKPGDELVITRFSRAARSTKNLLELAENLESRKVAFRSLHEGIDTTGPYGRCLVTVLAAIDQLTREVIQESAREGYHRRKAEAEAKGERMPSHGNYKSDEQVSAALAWITEHPEASYEEAGALFGVSRATLYRRRKSLGYS